MLLDDDAARSPKYDDDDNDKESRPQTNPYKKLMEQLYGRLHQSKTEEQEEDKEDKDGIKSFFVMKRNNTFMCLSTNYECHS